MDLKKLKSNKNLSVWCKMYTKTTICQRFGSTSGLHLQRCVARESGPPKIVFKKKFFRQSGFGEMNF